MRSWRQWLLERLLRQGAHLASLPSPAWRGSAGTPAPAARLTLHHAGGAPRLEILAWDLAGGRVLARVTIAGAEAVAFGLELAGEGLAAQRAAARLAPDPGAGRRRPF